MLDQSSPHILKGMYINGQWVQPAGTFDDMNPSDGSVWAKAQDGGTSEARSAVDAAQAAFPAWSTLMFQERAEYMLKIADIIKRRQTDYAIANQGEAGGWFGKGMFEACLLYTSPSPRDLSTSRMPSSA